jgi:CRISPR-associated protein Cmr2
MNETKKHLFLFTIGPVQSFIAQARKTGDLYAGSQILSDLIKKAIEEVGSEKVIFPFTYSDDETKWQNLESLPNRLIATIKEGEDLKAFGERIEKAVRDKWLEIAQKPILELLPQQTKENKSVKFDIAGINQQLEQHLDIFWLFEPLSNEYEKSYKNIEQNLGAIKNVRSFQQFNYSGIGEKGRKCSLDGERNAYFFGNGTNPNYFSNKWNPFAIELQQLDNVKVSPNEGLSAVSFAKRFYKDKSDEKQKFPSTAEIALQNIETNACISTKINSLKDLFKKDFDYQLLFDENLTEDYFKKNELNKKHLDKAKDDLKEIRKLAKDSSLKMNSYYALLSFDGDSMGEWLSKAKNEEQHRDFSKLLVEFANKAKAIVDKGGKTVYAGGDDFLGFVNLEYLFETIENLKAVFDAEVTKKVKIENGSKEFTMSMGVVIAHYKMPLRKVIQLNHKLLKETKEHFKNPANDYAISKSGIGICYTTANTMLGKTYINNIEELKMLKALTNYFIDNTISPSVLFKYHQSIAPIVGISMTYDEYSTQNNILSVELFRLVKRSTKSGMKEDVIEKLIKNKKLEFVGLAKFLKKQAKEVNINEWIIDIDNFLSFMKIATKLSSNYIKSIEDVVPIN